MAPLLSRRASAGLVTFLTLSRYANEADAMLSSAAIALPVSKLSQSAACTVALAAAMAALSVRSGSFHSWDAASHARSRNSSLTLSKKAMSVFSLVSASSTVWSEKSSFLSHGLRRKTRRIWRAVCPESACRMVIKFLRDLDILRPLISRWPKCQKWLIHWPQPWKASDWHSSLSWWGNFRSTPPAWISMLEPRISLAITEHSMCQPGRPPPHGESHEGSPALEAFQRAKSDADRFSPATAVCEPSDSAISASVALPFEGSSFG
mmetsp:Transcript_41364/g.82894  ORF Transcript_41364/g.82894 Transcript_41364/m.82894 type:complete len:264 (-) Transcript_41364:951-1742(-)